MCNNLNDVKKCYGNIAKANTQSTSLLVKESSISGKPIEEYSEALGYSKEEICEVNIQDTANLGLGCGNPTSLANLKEGETVIDLGSGAGFDAFLAAKRVGPCGRVIGIDMTLEMIQLSTENALKRECTNVEFILGQIENMPVLDSIADVIISNCVINLTSNKFQVFKEAARVLKSHGRLVISDIVAIAQVPDEVKHQIGLKYAGCIGGALEHDELELILKETGFEKIQIKIKDKSCDYISSWAPDTQIEKYIRAADILAVKI